MQPDTYYTQRLTTLQQQLAVLQIKKSRIAWLRFINVLAIVAGIYFLWSIGWMYVAGVALVLIVIFTRLVFADINNNKAITHGKHLIDINEDELKALAHNYYHFENGNEFIDPAHFYANDLDIFGKASLYQYINRTTSQMGGSTLAKWLLAPAGAAIIEQRQTAVKELTTKPEYRQQLQALGKEKKIQTATQSRLQEWFAGSNNFIENKIWLVLQYLIPAVVVTLCKKLLFTGSCYNCRIYF